MQNCSSSRPGPERDPIRAFTRKQFAEWSDRTFATYWSALRRLEAAGADPRVALVAAIRPNGSINVSRLARIADQELMTFVKE